MSLERFHSQKGYPPWVSKPNIPLIADLEEDEYELEEADLKDVGPESRQLQGSNSPHEALNFEEGHSGETIDWVAYPRLSRCPGRFHAHNHSIRSDDPLHDTRKNLQDYAMLGEPRRN